MARGVSAVEGCSFEASARKAGEKLLEMLDESEEAQVQQRHHALSPPSAAGRAVPAPGAMPVATLIGGRSCAFGAAGGCAA